MHIHGTVLSLEEQAQIRALKDMGLSNGDIPLQLGRSHGFVARYLRNPDGYLSAPSHERPRLLSSQDHRRIGRMVSNSTWGVNKIRSSTGPAASRTTIYRSIRMNDHIF
ncbi:unnamed protein product [Nippostrongylus brasiliensis]|uniref:HTH_Tnp_Tc3_1 domain-containing protein n=1 Tax=Nippostrongylus brasiliensis TaxID=27835 RepID=A0A0N4XKU0_NIPBR|nr:unnamed protein product [Nippostrongylus brasiliensis]